MPNLYVSRGKKEKYASFYRPGTAVLGLSWYLEEASLMGGSV